MPPLILRNGSIRRLYRSADSLQYLIPSKKPLLSERLRQAEASLSDPNFGLLLEPGVQIKQQLTLKPKRFEDALCLREIARIINQKCHIRFPDRNSIVNQVKELLVSDAHLNVLRTDIKKFFPSASLSTVIDFLCESGSLSASHIQLLNQIQLFWKNLGGSGIPMGLPISSSLSEVYMQNFDARIKASEGVYYYQRFVDDIILFTSFSADDAFDLVKRELSDPSVQLLANPLKTFRFNASENRTKPIEFEYLGYRFVRGTPKARKETDLEVYISKSKLDKIKHRLFSSFAQFGKDFNFSDLRGRIKYITGGPYLVKGSLRVKTGIHSSYRHITLSAKEQQIGMLDTLLKYKIVEARSKLNQQGLDALAKSLNDLFRFSFRSGFDNKISSKFTFNQVKKYTKIWNGKK